MQDSNNPLNESAGMEDQYANMSSSQDPKDLTQNADGTSTMQPEAGAAASVEVHRDMNECVKSLSVESAQTNGDPNIAVDRRLDYTHFQWFFIIFFTFIAVIDRYTTNLWPLWVDSPGPTIPGNFSVTVFSIISWVSSRMLLVSSSYLFLFQTRVFWNWFVEQKAVSKFLKISDIHQENIRMHYHVGWLFCGIPVVLHVWSIVFAAAFSQNSVKLYPNWMRPSDPDGNSIPFYADNLLSLGINDVYRLVSTSVTFFILIPYSVIKFCRDHNWSFAQYVHLFGALIYTVDLLRMYSHPHSWVFNAPFVLWWLCDRIYGIFYYRRCVAKVVHKVRLDAQYVVLYMRVPDKIYDLRAVGDIFYLNKLELGWDRAHPLTSFWNHQNGKEMTMTSKDALQTDWSGHKFCIRNDNEKESRDQYLLSRQNTVSVTDVPFDAYEINQDENGSIKEENDWNLGVIMQVFADHSDCYHRKTWTHEVYKYDMRFLCGLRCWGPYRSEYRLLARGENEDKYPSTPLVLIGTGAGCALLMEFYLYFTNNELELNEKVVMHFSTRSIGMFQWFTDVTCRKHVDNLWVNVHLTSHDNVVYEPKQRDIEKSRNPNIGRLDIEQILNADIANNTQVYFCGSPMVQEMVKGLCQKLSLTFHAGHTF